MRYLDPDGYSDPIQYLIQKNRYLVWTDTNTKFFDPTDTDTDIEKISDRISISDKKKIEIF